MTSTRLHVDLSALDENVATFRRLVGPSVRVMAMVKALAYGTDALRVSTRLQEIGVDYLGVATPDEGAELRGEGIMLPILVMLGSPDEMATMIGHRLIPLVYSQEMLDAVVAHAAPSAEEITVHVEVDTGMHRTGLPVADVVAAMVRLQTAGVRVEGVMTHLACADDPGEDAFTQRQLQRFRDAASAAADGGFADLIRHSAASAPAIRIPESRLDMIRLGLGIYGVDPALATKGAIPLRPVFGLVSRLLEVTTVSEGERVGYGGTYVAPPGGGRIGLVGAGYHDCVPRAFSNHGYVIVDGVRCPIVGTVSMDSMTVDLAGVPGAHVGSEVLIYGRHRGWNVPIDEVARAVGTIPNELMTRIGPRVERVFS